MIEENSNKDSDRFLVVCPAGHRIRVPHRHAGKKVRCPKCSHILQVPEIEASDEPEAVYEIEEADFLDESPPLPPPSRRKSKPIPATIKFASNDFDLGATVRQIKPLWGADGIAGLAEMDAKKARPQPNTRWKVLGISSAIILLVGMATTWVFMANLPSDSNLPQAVGSTSQSNSSPLPPSEPSTPPIVERPFNVVQLPESASQIVAAGSGRNLIALLPHSKQIVVLDVAEKTLAKTISIDDSDAVLAAGQTKFVVLERTNQRISRYNLDSFACEQTETCVPFCNLALGCSSEGPLLAIAPDLSVIDLPTLKMVKIQGGSVPFPANTLISLNASADGSCFAGGNASTPASIFTVKNVGTTWKYSRANASDQYVVPSADGAIVYTDKDVIEWNGNVLGNSQAKNRFNIPGTTGPWVLGLEWSAQSSDQNFTRLAVQHPSEKSPLMMVSDVTLPISPLVMGNDPQLQQPAGKRLPLNQQIFWLPNFDSLVTIPPNADQFLIHRLNLREEQEKAGNNYLYVSSIPPHRCFPGKPFSHQIEVVSKSGGVQFALRTGPPGMSISSDGLMSWNVPAVLVGNGVMITIVIRDTAGQEITQSYKLTTGENDRSQGSGPNPAPSTPAPSNPAPSARPPRSGNPQSARSSNNPNITVGGHDKSIVPLASAASHLAVGGSGRYVLAVLPALKQVVVVDITARQVVKTIVIDDTDTLVAGCQSKFVIHQRTMGTLARYDFISGECELKIACEPYRHLTMGIASEGPLLAIGTELLLIDLPSMKVNGLEAPGGRFSGHSINHASVVFDAGADGKSFVGHGHFSPPGRYSLELISGAWRCGYEHLGNPNTGRFYGASDNLFLTREQSRLNPGHSKNLVLQSPSGNSPLLVLSDIEIPSPSQPGAPEKSQLPLNQRVMWLSAADAIVSAPLTNDQLIVQHFNPQEDLRKSEHSFLHVISPLHDRFQPGERYSYQIDVLSKSDVTQYSLLSGPVGMAISDDGWLNWDVPAAFTESNIAVSFGIRTSTEQDSVHQLNLSADSAPSSGKTAQKPSKKPTSSRPSLAQRPKTGSNDLEKSIDEVRKPAIVPLPAPSETFVVGGSGKYLIAFVPPQKSLVIVDVVARELRTTIPVEGPVLFAAGETKLVVCQREAGTLSRYDLATGEAELTVTGEKYHSLALGSSSEGPVIVGGENIDFLDLQTFQPTGLGVKNIISILPVEDVRAAANGQIFTASSRRGGFGTWMLEIDGAHVQKRGCPPTINPQPIKPSYDGTIIFSGLGRFDRDWKLLTPNDDPNTMKNLFPAATGPYFLSLFVPESAGLPNRRSSRLTLHCQHDDQPVLTITGVTLPMAPQTRSRGHAPNIDLRYALFLLPKADALVAVSEKKDQLSIYPFSIQAELDRSGVDYFFSTSPTAHVIQPGQILKYSIEVVSKYGDLKFQQERGPAGMKVSERGEVSWQVPKDFAGQEVNAVIHVRNGAGQELSHSIRLLNSISPGPQRR